MNETGSNILSFEKKMKHFNLSKHREETRTLQINLGKRCNQACAHCHVGAGPDCQDNMSLETIDRVLELLRKDQHIQVVDITGGAPELNPHFKYLVKNLRDLKLQVIDRCNLTVFFEEGQENMPEFLAEQGVQVIASMPCYLEENVKAQRGQNVFEKSIKALQKLNGLGYGKEGSGLQLNLVYNPAGMGLPPEQAMLQNDYKHHLKEHYGVDFNDLLTITNMPIKRFKNYLEAAGKLSAYETLLAEQFNPTAAERIMCRELISVGWDGSLYDCDFNQALDIPVQSRQNLWNIDGFYEVGSEITFDNHCYGCTAGYGSSCKGALL